MNASIVQNRCKGLPKRSALTSEIAKISKNQKHFSNITRRLRKDDEKNPKYGKVQDSINHKH